jgi:hypothetical protein
MRHLPQLAVGVKAVHDLVAEHVRHLGHPVQGIVVIARCKIDERGVGGRSPALQGLALFAAQGVIGVGLGDGDICGHAHDLLLADIEAV